MKELEVTGVVNLPDGLHKGKIVRVEYRTDPFEYTDVIIKESETGVELKYGSPTKISVKDRQAFSKLAKLLINFTELKQGGKVVPETVLMDKEVTFMTMQEKGKDGNSYVTIVENSVKPLVATETVAPGIAKK